MFAAEVSEALHGAVVIAFTALQKYGAHVVREPLGVPSVVQEKSRSYGGER